MSTTGATIVTDEPAADASTGTSRLPSIVALLGGAVAVSFAPIFAKIAMYQGGLGASATGFWRIGLSVPVLLSFWMVLALLPGRRTTNVTPRRRPLWIWASLLLPGLIFGGDLAVWHFSFHYTSAAAATLLANCQVVLVGLVSWLVLRETLRWQYPVGAGLALIGVVMLLAWGGDPIIDGRNPLIGNLFALLTACFYASYILSVQYVRRHFSTLPVIVVTSVIAAGVLLVVALLSGEQIRQTTPTGWWAAIGLAIVPHCLGQGLIVFALARLPASFTSVTLLLQPVGAGVLAWLMLGELLSMLQIAAGVVVLIGIYLARRGSV